jgi:hypothetical protein
MTTTNPIFDNTQPELLTTPSLSKLWLKAKIPKSQISPSIVFSGPIGKRTNKEAKVADREYILTSSHLYYKSESSDRLRGQLDLKWVRLAWTENDGRFGEVGEDEYPYVIMLMRNGKYTEMFVKSKADLEIWLGKFKELVVFSGFYGRFRVVRFLGSGAYAKVRFGFFLF